MLFHKQYHRLENNTIIDSIQFFNIPDTTELDTRDITKTYLKADKSIDRIEDYAYDQKDSLIIKVDYIPYFNSDTLIRFSVFYFDTISFLLDQYYKKENKLIRRIVALSLTKDTLEDQEYFINGNKPYKMLWTHFEEVPRKRFKAYEEDYFYKGDYIDYRIRNVFDENQTILFSYKDVRLRDANNRLILEKYHTFDSTAMDYIFDGYRIVYGAPLLSEIKVIPNAKNNSLNSSGRIISWGQGIENQFQLKIISADGRDLFTTNLTEQQNTFVWPSSIRPGVYIVQIIGKKLSISKALIKLP